MYHKNKISHFLKSDLFLLYFPIILFLIYNIIFFFNIQTLTSSSACVIFIINALTLIPACKQKTKYRTSVILFALGIFSFGIVDTVWVVIDKLLYINPTSNVFLSCFYIITNICFVMAIILFVIASIKNMHPVQMVLDLTVVSFLTIGVLLILFFRIKVFGQVIFNAFDVLQFLYLALDCIGITTLIFLFISARSEKVQIYNLVVFVGIIVFFIADTLFIKGTISNNYSHLKLIDWLYMLSLTIVTLAVKIYYKRHKNAQESKTAVLYLNEGRVKYAWLIFIVPVFIYFAGGHHMTDLVVFAAVVISYLILSLYIQKDIANEKQLLSKTAYNEVLEKQLRQRNIELENANKSLKYLIQHDSLTGLLSRQRFFELADKQINKCRNGKILYLITMDIEKFGVINELYGFTIGDKVLRRISDNIREIFQGNSHIARTDSNEFCVLCYDTKFEEINKKLKKIYLVLQNSIKVSSFQLSVSVRVGIAEYPKNAINRIDLIKCAKTSLSQAKKLNSNSYYLYNDEIHKKILRNVEIELALRKADINSEFSLHYQPIFDISGMKIIGIEALVRWNSPQIGQVGPVEFISIAEETGIILNLGAWIMETAMRHIKELNEKYDCALFMGINISPIQLKNTNFVDKVRELIFENGVMPNWINFEITENLKITEQDEKTLTQLTSMGISLSIDDFGTGYSSYNYLNKFSFDYIKINKHLIDNITFKQNDAQIVKSIITMAKIMNIKVLAEGVETTQQMDLLYSMGCDYIQGFIYAKPVPFEQLKINYLAVE